ncbi:hypothetical protein GIB67_036868 [Kingdonia uniflora]|uniref:Aminotransferase-like plant mobile domain-containing protein n=1 Tax=Kingdonia uniflora TaxID=39325 RepID=A0A7J7LX21_9MAGN|nr:hypothetical protein GIB67_036868 [Kingdonia uniflora]
MNANEGVSEALPSTESAQGVNIPQGSEFKSESAQAALGAQPPLPNVSPAFDVNIPIIEGYSEGEGATSNNDVGPSDKSLLRSFRFYRARSIAIGQEKLPIRVHHHQSTWDLTKEPQVVQNFVKMKGLDRIGAISYNYYNSALISVFAERWQPETNSFHFKWGEMTLTLDDVEQLAGLLADGDATVIGGIWGFSAILEVFENNLNLLQDLNALKSLKAGGAGNSLSLKKLKEHYAYKLEKVLSDGTAVASKKKKGLTTRSVARAYMLYVLGSFLFPTKKRTDVSARYLYLFANDKVAKKWSWGSAVLAHMYYNLDRYSGPALLKFREALDNYKLEDIILSNSTIIQSSLVVNIQHCQNEHVVWDPYKDKRDFAHAFKEVTFFYGALASPDHVQPYYPNRVVRQFNREQGIPTKRLLTKWKGFVLKKADRGRVREGPLVCTEAYLEWFAFILWTTICPITVNLGAYDDVRIHQRKPASVNEHGDTPVHQSEDINEQYDASTSECDMLKETIEQIKEEIELKRVVDEQCALEFADLPRQLNAKILEYTNLEEKNTSLEAELKQKSGIEDCNQSLSVELNKKCKEIESLKAVNALLMEQIDLQLSQATPLTVLQSHQPILDTTLAKKYEDLLAAHEDGKKKLIAKEDFISYSK